MSAIKAVYWVSEPVCTVLPQEHEDRLKLVEKWSFCIVRADGSGEEFRVPAGFRFEGSVPRLFWRLITPTDPAAWAGFCAHDWLYLLVKIGKISRADADRVLKLALERNGFGWFVVGGVYAGVRSCGWRYSGKPLSRMESEELKAGGLLFAYDGSGGK